MFRLVPNIPHLRCTFHLGKDGIASFEIPYRLLDIRTMRWLIVSLCYTTWTICWAQSSYRPLPLVDAEWVESHRWLQPGSVSSPYEWHECNDRILLIGSVVWNEQVYSRLKLIRHCSVQPIGGTFDTAAYFSYTVVDEDFMYYREDTLLKMSYAVSPSGDQQEYLLFDMNMAIGPYPYTIFNPDLFEEPELFVVAMDSVALNDGWHRRWRIADGPDHPPFTDLIEGIGLTTGWNPANGILAAPFEWSDALHCHTRNAALVFQSEGFFCTLANDVPERGFRDQWTVWPMPATDQIELKGPADDIARFRVIDVHGRTVLEGPWKSEQLDCSQWSHGVHVLELSSRSGKPPIRLKVIKQ